MKDMKFDKENQHFAGHVEKLVTVCRLLELYTIPRNSFSVEKCYNDFDNQNTWDTIVVTSKRRDGVRYQLLNNDEWTRIHCAGCVKDLLKIVARLVDDVNDRGW